MSLWHPQSVLSRTVISYH
uniref:Uncharacterized protein n=1 Tax=Arundo donax TaxID=35708 RepID=A0A0A9AJG5_ARUDO